jgi:hypothetical protein
MPLSKKQVDGARGYAEKARHGDTKAIQFFADQEALAAAGNVNAKEYLDIRDGKGAQGRNGKKALLDTKVTHLSPKQVEAAVGVALTIDDGNENGKTFWSTQQQLAHQGSVIAQEYCDVIEEVIEKKKKGIDIYQRPGSTTPVSPQEKIAAALTGKKPQANATPGIDPKSAEGLKARRDALRQALTRADADLKDAEEAAKKGTAPPDAETKKDIPATVHTP